MSTFESTRVFPARAGMIPSANGLPTPLASIPRESGDDPCGWWWSDSVAWYSPRERG